MYPAYQGMAVNRPRQYAVETGGEGGGLRKRYVAECVVLSAAVNLVPKKDCAVETERCAVHGQPVSEKTP